MVGGHHHAGIKGVVDGTLVGERDLHESVLAWTPLAVLPPVHHLRIGELEHLRCSASRVHLASAAAGRTGGARHSASTSSRPCLAPCSSHVPPACACFAARARSAGPRLTAGARAPR